MARSRTERNEVFYYLRGDPEEICTLRRRIKTEINAAPRYHFKSTCGNYEFHESCFIEMQNPPQPGGGQNPINKAIDGAVDSVITSAASFLLGDPTENLTAAQTSDHPAQFCSVDVVNSAANQPRFYFYMAPYRQQSDSDGFNVHSPQLRQ